MVERFVNRVKFDSYEDFKENFKLVVPDHFNFGYDVVDEWAKEEPNKVALCWTNDKGEHIDFTFADMKRETDKTAAYFQSLGIGKGDMVMLILKRRYEFWFSIIALHKIGAVVIPATHLLTKKDIVYRCNAADIKAIVAYGDEIITTHVNDSVAESPSLKFRISIGPLVPEGWEDFHKGINSAPAFVPPARNDNDDMMLLYFTSGTTGNPKMVVHSFTYPLGHIVTGKYWHNLNENCLHLTVADTGWGKCAWGKLYGQWISGATVFVYDHVKFNPADMLAIIEKYHINSFCAPPTVFRFMMKEGLKNYDLSSLKQCFIAGEPLNPVIYQDFYNETGIKLMEGFGQTETVVSIATFPWMEPKPGSMGRPNPIFDVDLIAPDGHSVEDGEHGEVVFRLKGGHQIGLFLGYYRDQEKTNECIAGGVYHTGDIAWRDEDGYFWFVGRTDDVIKSSGYRIGPFEVESALLTHPAVLECAITGVPDEIRGQVVKATIVLTKEYKGKGDADLIKNIQDYVKKTTAPYKYPRIIEFVDEMPKTISGKIKRSELRDNKK
ncbi:MAG: AMP-binding protein [Paludibacteraceae bacterium]|nr:AMP-binding protein [Paludibacteraceae bacterium]